MFRRSWVLAEMFGPVGPGSEKIGEAFPRCRVTLAFVVDPSGEAIFGFQVGGSCVLDGLWGLQPVACHSRQPPMIHRRMPGHSAFNFSVKLKVALVRWEW